MNQRGITHHQQMQNMFTNANGYVERHKHRQEQVQKQKAFQMQRQKALQMQWQKVMGMQRQKVMGMQMRGPQTQALQEDVEQISKVPLESKVLKNQKFNILIRNTYRPTYFKNCINSILSQTYNNYNIIMCYDDDRCLEYLKNYEEYDNIIIFKVKTPDKSKSHFYNLYMNELLDYVKDDWIIGLDDDAVFMNNNALSTISKYIVSTNDVLFWKYKLGNRLIFPRNKQDIHVGRVDTSMFCFHSKNKNKSSWSSIRCGDYYFLSKLLNNIVYSHILIDHVLTSAQAGKGLVGMKEKDPTELNAIQEKIKNIKKLATDNLNKIINIQKNINNGPTHRIIIKEAEEKKKKFISSSTKIGVIITTHGDNGIFVDNCIKKFIEILPKNTYIVLFINESNDPITLNLCNKYSSITVVHNKDQLASGGLTGTWNKGIDMCFENNADTIILSNDDVFCDNTIYHILYSAHLNKNKLNYYGPVSNKPGRCMLKKNSTMPCQYSEKSLNIYDYELDNKDFKKHLLNGFFLVFPKHVLIKNKFNNKLYFDLNYPFGGNENEWARRFMKKNGTGIVVSKTFIYHFKFNSWMSEKISERFKNSNLL